MRVVVRAIRLNIVATVALGLAQWGALMVTTAGTTANGQVQAQSVLVAPTVAPALGASGAAALMQGGREPPGVVVPEVSTEAPTEATASGDRLAVAPAQAPGSQATLPSPAQLRPDVGLPPELAQAIRTAGLDPSQVGLAAIEVAEGRPLASWNADRPFNPASTMKLLTTFAALSILGPDYRWHTRAYLRGKLEGGVLDGDLVLKGGGDPKLVIEDLTAFVTRMRTAGLREIRGDLLIDDSLYQSDALAGESIDGDTSQPYNVRPYPLLMNFKATRLVAQPRGRQIALSTDPPLAGIDLENAVTVASGGRCRHGVNGLTVRDAGTDRQPAIRVNGAYSPACGEQGAFTAVLSHRQFIQAIFKAAWQTAGGTWHGEARIAPGSARGAPWLDWVSPRTLADVVQDVNKFSNNVMARQLLLQTVVERRGQPASVDAARRVLTNWLTAGGMKFPELVIENGSGLSRQERISPEHLAELLRHVAVSDVGDVMRGSMPRVGVDGTMRNRLIGQPVAGNAWIKTGTLNDVRAIAGFVDAAGGRRYAVVMMINGPRAETGARLLDSFLSWVYDHG